MATGNVGMSVTVATASQAFSHDWSAGGGTGNKLVLATMAGLITMPMWNSWLGAVSDAAAAAAPILGLLIGLATLRNALRGSDAGKVEGARAKMVTEALANAGGMAKRGGLWAVTFAAAFALGSLLLYLISPRKDANAAPAPRAAFATKRRSSDAAGDDGDVDGEPAPDGAPPWFLELWKLRGLHEGTRRKPNPTVQAMFAAAGHPEIRDTTGVAWCAAAVAYGLARVNEPPAKTLSARDWLRWGEAIKQPRVGCVVVLWRGSPRGWQGHVGYFVREDATHVYLLGGNQSDSVSVAKFAKSRVLGYRWPRKASTINAGASASAAASAAAAATAVGTAATHTPPPNEPMPPAPPLDATVFDAVSAGLKDMVPLLPWAGVAAGVVGIAAALYVVWRRYQHKQRTGT